MEIQLKSPLPLVVQLPLTVTVSICCNTNLTLLTYLNNKLFSHELKILNYDGLWENKIMSDENQHFTDIGWLISVDSLKSIVYLDDLTCLTITQKT